MFKSNKGEGVVTPKMLMVENQKLREENQRLKKSMERVNFLKEEYEKLIDEMKKLRKQYCDKLVEVNKLVKGYEKELEKMLD